MTNVFASMPARRSRRRSWALATTMAAAMAVTAR